METLLTGESTPMDKGTDTVGAGLHRRVNIGDRYGNTQGTEPQDTQTRLQHLAGPLPCLCRWGSLSSSVLCPPFRTNMAFQSTTVVRGRAMGCVVNTGKTTEIGRISAAIAGASVGKTPLQKKLAKLGQMLVGAALLACGLVVAAGLAWNPKDAEIIKVMQHQRHPERDGQRPGGDEEARREWEVSGFIPSYP